MVSPLRNSRCHSRHNASVVGERTLRCAADTALHWITHSLAHTDTQIDTHKNIDRPRQTYTHIYTDRCSSAALVCHAMYHSRNATLFTIIYTVCQIKGATLVFVITFTVAKLFSKFLKLTTLHKLSCLI